MTNTVEMCHKKKTFQRDPMLYKTPYNCWFDFKSGYYNTTFYHCSLTTVNGFAKLLLVDFFNILHSSSLQASTKYGRVHL